MSKLSEAMTPILAKRHPEKSLQEIAEMIKRLEMIGLDANAVRYQVEHGLLR